ncbi:MAG: DMT family transporter [Hyphomicrobiaceae bacterium]|nr:DMT family transporter [Hyphomicrobiaceae bacterium]
MNLLHAVSAPGRYLRRLPANLVAALLMIAAFVIFSVMAVLARQIGGHIPVIQMVLVRQVLAIALMAPLFWRMRALILSPRRLDLHAARGVSATGAMLCGLSAVLLIPLADATAIQMAEVLFATAFAALFLGERVGWRRWSATAVGFVGVAIMVRPFGGGLELNALVALFGALCGAANMIILRVGAEYDRTETVLFWQGLVILVLVTPPALWFWVTPTPFDWLILVAMSLIFTAGIWLFTTALRMGETSALAPLNYLRLILMALIGWAIYGEAPTLASAAGAILVLAAATNAMYETAQTAPRPDGD